MIVENLAAVRKRLEAACLKSGRSPGSVALMAVTKQVGTEQILEAIRAGVTDIGENRVQEAQSKFPALPAVRRHLIGHLQSNKANRAVELFDCIQSVDSAELLRKIDRRAGELGKTQDCLIEIKVSEEPSKAGLAAEGLAPLLEEGRKLKSVRISGLMGIPPFFEDPENARPYFARVRELAEKNFAGSEKPVLSMGMSHDFEIAVEEGSTMIRVGTALFGARTKA
jgi:pyridoxal phosphate enzyme (YggS family)